MTLQIDIHAQANSSYAFPFSDLSMYLQTGKLQAAVWCFGPTKLRLRCDFWIIEAAKHYFSCSNCPLSLSNSVSATFAR